MAVLARLNLQSAFLQPGEPQSGVHDAQQVWPVISFHLKPFTQPVSQQSGRADLVCLHWEN